MPTKKKIVEPEELEEIKPVEMPEQADEQPESVETPTTEDVPIEDVPIEDVPTEDVPTEDVPIEDAPAEDVPITEEAPAKPDKKKATRRRKEVPEPANAAQAEIEEEAVAMLMKKKTHEGAAVVDDNTSSAKRAAAEKAAGGDRVTMLRDARARERERKREQAEKEQDLMNWSALQNAMRSKSFVRVVISSVRIMEDQKMVVANGLLNGLRITIPYSEAFVNPVAMDDADEKRRLNRQVRVLQKLIGCEVPVIIMGMQRRAEHEYAIVASRRIALMMLRRINFEGDAPRIVDGTSVMADIIATAEHGIRVCVGGFDVTIPPYRLTCRYITNAAVHYNAGDQIRVIVRGIQRDADGNVVSMRPSALEAELEDLRPRVRNVTVGETCIARITRIPPPREDRPCVVHPRLFLEALGIPAVARSTRTDTMATPLKSGDTVLFRVTLVDSERGVAVGDILRRI